MAILNRAGELEKGQARIQPYLTSTSRFDWTAALLSAWVIGGAYLDGWAHSHGFVDDVFVTPWHAVLYSGVLALFLFLMAHQWRNMSKGIAWQHALPEGYRTSLLGAALFLIGGGFDFLWHTLFGIEVNLETLLSPSHLFLATSAALMISGPIRAAWERLAPGEAHGWKNIGPMTLSATMVLSLLTFFTQYAHPISAPISEKVGGLDPGRYDDLYVMNADGSSQTRLTTSPDTFSWGSAWSPDGRQIVFARGEVTGEHNPESALYLMDSDGRNIQQLTDMPGWEYLPAWSPDSTQIAFINYQEDHAKIYVIHANGTGPQKLTDTDAPEIGPAWSPDSTKIVFTSNASGSDQLYVMDADGSDVKQITSQGSGNWGADWSPDGARIVFNSSRDGNFDIYTIQPDGTGEQRLTDDKENQLVPAWSPDGRQIAFVFREHPGSDQVFVMNADGSDAHNLTQNHALMEIYYPRWSPDGTKILYSGHGYLSNPEENQTKITALASILIQAALLMGVILLLVKRWALPFGAIAFILTLNGSMMSVFNDRYEFGLTALSAGLVAEFLLWRLKPAEARQKEFYAFAFAVPFVFYSLYFLTLQITQGIGWTLHLWMGSIFLAGIAGLLVSFLLVPPFKTARSQGT